MTTKSDSGLGRALATLRPSSPRVAGPDDDADDEQEDMDDALVVLVHNFGGSAFRVPRRGHQRRRDMGKLDRDHRWGSPRQWMDLDADDVSRA
jgi:hypothetical protein